MNTDIAVRAGKLLGAALLLAMAIIHVLLWLEGYRDIPVIGPAFLVNGIGGVLLAIAIVAMPRRLLFLTAAASMVFTAGTLAALVVSLTVGLFGVAEQLSTPLVPTTLWVESAGVLALAALAWLTRPKAHTSTLT